MKQFLAAACCIFLLSSCADQIVDNPPPSTYVLKQNYPNPFADSTVIEYGIPLLGGNNPAPHIKLVVYDRFQRKQVTLVDNPYQAAGNFKVTWTGKGVNGFKVPTGIYYILLMQDHSSFLEYDETEVLLRITAFKK